MADLDLVASNSSHQIRTILDKISSLTFGVLLLTIVIGAATFATGLWIFDGDGDRQAWIVIGGLLCLVPIVAAFRAWWAVRRVAGTAPNLPAEVRSLLATARQGATVLVDLDGGRSIIQNSKSLTALRDELNERRKEFPALAAGVRAIVRAPGLAAVAVLGALFSGAVGTVLLIGGLID